MPQQVLRILRRHKADIYISPKKSVMKKKKVNLSKLSLNKEVISHLSQEKITGGAPTRIMTCLGTCNTVFDCPMPTLKGHSCVDLCEP